MESPPFPKKLERYNGCCFCGKLSHWGVDCSIYGAYITEYRKWEVEEAKLQLERNKVIAGVIAMLKPILDMYNITIDESKLDNEYRIGLRKLS